MRISFIFLLRACAGPIAAMGIAASSSSSAAETVVHVAPLEDLKAVIASVEPVHQLVARARIGGTVTALKIKEGDVVIAGAEIASVADQKLFLQMQGLDQRIRSQQAQRDKAKADLDKAVALAPGGARSYFHRGFVYFQPRLYSIRPKRRSMSRIARSRRFDPTVA